MVNNPLVFIIVLNYNGQKYLDECLTSIKLQTYQNYKIIVFDNASKDNSVNYVSRAFPSVILLQSEKNLGFAEGNNVAIKFALSHGANYVFLLNNDTIIKEDSLDKLVATAECDGSIGIVGPAIFDIENRKFLQEAGMTTDMFGFPVSLKYYRNDSNSEVSEVFYLSGCALLIKADVLKEIGSFDQEYFMFAEDLDLCWRAQLMGYKVVVNKTSKIYHKGGGSISGGVAKTGRYSTDVRRIFLREKNTLRTLIKNYDDVRVSTTIPLDVALLFFESIFWSILLKPRMTVGILKAIYWNIKNFPDTFQQRKRVQSLRKSPDSNIKKKMISGLGKLVIFRIIGVPNFSNK